jgi:hypothetical protein
MAMTVQQIHPVAHVPLVRGVLRRLEVATLSAGLLPPHPAPGLSCGRGGEALVLAMLAGPHALYKVGKRLAERGMVPLLQPELTRAALNDYRLGHSLDALFAANLHQVFRAIALQALEVSALPTPWLPQATTTMRLSGASADEPQSPEAPHPAYGHSQDGRDDLKQGLLSLGGRGAGGLPLRIGLREGHRRASVETPLAIAACRALGLDGVRGSVAERTASRRRPLGCGLAQGLGFVPFVPRTCAVRQAREAWGRQQPAVPLRVEQPGRRPHEAPRRWHGQRGLRPVEGAYREGRRAHAPLRFVVGHSRQLAQQQTQA